MAAGPFVGSEGVAAIKSWTESQVSTKANIDDVYSKTEIDTLIDDLNALRILNKGVVNATTATVQEVCTQYVSTNYSRTPEDFDCIIVTLTDKDNDKVNYMYSTASTSWIDIGRNLVEISYATDTVAGILKLVNNVTSTATDTAPTVGAVKGAIDTLTTNLTSLTQSVSTLTTTVEGKASQTDLDALETTVGTKANSADVYTKTDIDSKFTEVNSSIDDIETSLGNKADTSALPVAMTEEEVLAILNGTTA